VEALAPVAAATNGTAPTLPNGAALEGAQLGERAA
jgi:hypothetical protein